MVVDTLHMGNRLQRTAKRGYHALFIHIRGQAARAEAVIAGVGHGRVQHDFLVLLVGEPGKAVGVAPVGQEGQRKRLIQVCQSLTFSKAVAHVIDDDGNGRG